MLKLYQTYTYIVMYIYTYYSSSYPTKFTFTLSAVKGTHIVKEGHNIDEINKTLQNKLKM